MSNIKRHPDCRMKSTNGNCSPMSWFCTSNSKESCEVMQSACRVGYNYFITEMLQKSNCLECKYADTRGDVVSLMMEIEEAPTIDIVRPKGEWIFNPKDAIDLMFTKPKCSKCGFESADGGNFCPNCGADMRGGTENE